MIFNKFRKQTNERLSTLEKEVESLIRIARSNQSIVDEIERQLDFTKSSIDTLDRDLQKILSKIASQKQSTNVMNQRLNKEIKDIQDESGKIQEKINLLEKNVEMVSKATTVKVNLLKS